MAAIPGFSQKTERTFIFGHSLINHAEQVNPTPSQETSIPHWFQFLSDAGGHNYAVAGQYGFLPQHANLPPSPQWGFDVVEGAWDADFEEFSDADFTSILLTPANFIQYQGSDINYEGMDISPVEATNTIFNWCNAQEPEMNYYIYENWPDMASFLGNSFPPTNSEWINYNDYLNGEFHNWFIDYHDFVTDANENICVKMIPVGPIISKILNQAPFNEIPITDLYEDDAPHGRPTIYFLGAMITYMAMYEEMTPADFEVDDIIHPIVRDNYESLTNIIWKALLDFDYEDGQSRVFCSEPISNSIEETKTVSEIEILPNPARDFLTIESKDFFETVELINISSGQKLILKTNTKSINIRSLKSGVYIMKLLNHEGRYLKSKRFVKI